jgi:hypothetical protein
MCVSRRAVIHLLWALGACAPALAAPASATKTLQVQLVDAGALTVPASNLIVAHSVAQAAASDLQPAPLPNLDVQPPNASGAPVASLNPALLSRKPEFEGHGFGNFSNLDYAIDEKQKPAAGLNLSVPLSVPVK